MEEFLTEQYQNHPEKACRGVETWRFYSQSPHQINKLKVLCNSCPLLVPCRNYAIEHENFGVWGGTSERDRIKIRRQLKKTVKLLAAS